MGKNKYEIILKEIESIDKGKHPSFGEVDLKEINEIQQLREIIEEVQQPDWIHFTST